jgi:DNA-binding transcriptional ArsR family regulator
MLSTASFAETAALVGDPARANMLAALMDGRALTAAELARVAGITPQTASGHLARLVTAGLLALERQGRHRYHRLASPEIARMLENIMAVATKLNHANGSRVKSPLVVGPRDKALRHIRTCYDHLAGRIAVAMADRMVELSYVEFSSDSGMLTKDGAAFLNDLGVNLDSGKTPRSRQIFCRPCLDWSERRPHIAGAVGTAICQACFSQGWIRRIEGTRAVSITPAGHVALSKAFGSGIAT